MERRPARRRPVDQPRRGTHLGPRSPACTASRFAPLRRRPPIQACSLQERSKASSAPPTPAHLDADQPARQPRDSRGRVAGRRPRRIPTSSTPAPGICPGRPTDGGKNWHNIKQGLIDDSDVFSIILDPAQPSTVFLSACSGIYKSENAAELFHKIQGIPSTARRTRVLKQDPANREVVYAGTTEGLYKTVDGGKTFERMTGPDVIVNDVFVDPRDSESCAAGHRSRRRALSARTRAASFAASNEGFSERKVEALLVDRGNPARLYAGVVNDKTYGGVFVSTDGGAAGSRSATGLDGRDVFALAQAKDGTVLAGTNHGIFALDERCERSATPVNEILARFARCSRHWKPRNTIANTRDERRHRESGAAKRVNVEKQVKAD